MNDFRDDRSDGTIHVRVSADLRAALEREAARSERTISGQVRHYLARAVEAQRGGVAA